MKKLVMTAMMALALGAQGFAGEETSSKAAIDKSVAGAEWFMGGTAEYIHDSSDDFYTFKLGKRFYASDTFSWALFGEVGYSSIDYGSIQADYVPITVNAEARYHFNDRWAVYAGLGAGTSYVSDDVYGFTVDNDQWNLTLQAFTGLAYSVTPQFEVNVGARVQWIRHDHYTEDMTSFGLGATWSF
jgi:opacity protein-like surface antigen